MKKNILFFTVLIIILFLDQLSKLIVRNYLANADFVITSFFKLSLNFNTGGVFGMLTNCNLFFIILTCVVIGIMIFYRQEFLKSKNTTFFYALILAGALGNLIDRFFLGKVTDFISVGWWPSFNIADSAITIGIICIILWSIKK